VLSAPMPVDEAVDPRIVRNRTAMCPSVCMRRPWQADPVPKGARATDRLRDAAWRKEIAKGTPPPADLD